MSPERRAWQHLTKKFGKKLKYLSIENTPTITCIFRVQRELISIGDQSGWIQLITAKVFPDGVHFGVKNHEVEIEGIRYLIQDIPPTIGGRYEYELVQI